MIGRTIAQYRILERLGSGGMGVVYKGEDTRLSRFVALKFLPKELSRDPRALERFQREARTASALNHPHICTIYDLGEHDAQPFIVMELLEGRTLGEHIGGNPLRIQEVTDLGIQIAEALDAAHGRGIVHRDIKPGNIFITSRGTAKILDFGVAKLITEGSALDSSSGVSAPEKLQTRSDVVMGTVIHMSPEQARGGAVDARTDIFSFGTVLYEMCTGRQAFPGTTTAVVYDAILNKPPVAPSRLNSDIPPDLEKITLKALEKDMRVRYQSAREIRVDLVRLKRETEFLAEARLRLPSPAESDESAALQRPGRRLGVVLVDDEELARGVLKEYLASHSKVEILAECSNGFEAVKAVSELKPDLLFLDIQMPKLNGFEVLELIGREVAVIFVTAYDEFALRAFEVHAVDYLLKPFSAERLAEALEHASKRIGRHERQPLDALVDTAREHSKPLERILVRDASRVHVLPVDKVDYVEAQDDYVCLKSGGKSFLKQQTLTELEALLDPNRFIRIHRSYILNVERLARLELYTKDSRLAILNDGTQLPVSRSGYARLRPLL